MSEKSEFRFCPQCKSENITETDYEDDDGEEDTDGRACSDCGWEGDVGELVMIEGKP